ncbi:helix-turn-helix transcriptional regulator [Streptomyces sp. NPDC046203]|uniref:helix-turn-helix domain-containing protein n=1 Tax=Streptomyces sp. NPDC046203 TaxID=3154602 RepID=UPI0033E9F717
MVNIKALNPEGGPEAAYGARIRGVREERGWRQDDLATQTGYSSKHISAVETGRRSSTLAFSKSLDVAFGLADTVESFEREWRKLRHGNLLEGFPEFLGYEGRASEIRLYEVGVIPGLLQTPAYAAALADSAVRRGAATPEQASERVALVAKRQAALDRTPPPVVMVVLDEGCIRRPLGGADVMSEQFAHLAEFAERPNTVLQVAPFRMGGRRPFNLPITVLTLPDRSVMCYAESAQRGHLERESSVVLPLLGDYHQLQAEAPSQKESVAMIEQVRKGTS